MCGGGLKGESRTKCATVRLNDLFIGHTCSESADGISCSLHGLNCLLVLQTLIGQQA